MNMLQTMNGNSLYLTKAVDGEGKEVLADIFINGVTGFFVEVTKGECIFTLSFETEALAQMAYKKTNWVKVSNQQLKGSLSNLGIKVNELHYRGFELLSYTAKGVVNG